MTLGPLIQIQWERDQGQLDEAPAPGLSRNSSVTHIHTQGRRASSGAHLDLVGPLASGGGMHEAAMMTQTAQQSNQEEMKETKV